MHNGSFRRGDWLCKSVPVLLALERERRVWLVVDARFTSAGAVAALCGVRHSMAYDPNRGPRARMSTGLAARRYITAYANTTTMPPTRSGSWNFRLLSWMCVVIFRSPVIVPLVRHHQYLHGCRVYCVKEHNRGGSFLFQGRGFPSGALGKYGGRDRVVRKGGSRLWHEFKGG